MKNFTMFSLNATVKAFANGVYVVTVYSQTKTLFVDAFVARSHDSLIKKVNDSIKKFSKLEENSNFTISHDLDYDCYDILYGVTIDMQVAYNEILYTYAENIYRIGQRVSKDVNDSLLQLRNIVLMNGDIKIGKRELEMLEESCHVKI